MCKKYVWAKGYMKRNRNTIRTPIFRIFLQKKYLLDENVTKDQKLTWYSNVDCPTLEICASTHNNQQNHNSMKS